MSNINKKNKNVIWQKEPYVWMIIFFPVLAIVGGIVTTYLAVESNDGLVVDDYYKQGLEINRTKERDKVASDYQLNADININDNLEEVTITLHANQDFDHPQNLSATFLNATRSGLDKEAKLLLINENVYRGHLSRLNSGKWYVYIQHGDWRLIKDIVIK